MAADGATPGEWNGEQGREWNDWRARVERLVAQGVAAGLTRQQIVRLVSELLYRLDFGEVGPAVDLGLFSWKIYLRDSELIVGWLLTQSGGPQDSRRDRIA